LVADRLCLSQLLSLEREVKELKTKTVSKEQQEDSQPMMGPGFGSRLMLTQGPTGGMQNGMNSGMMMNGGMMPQPTGFY
jgi:clathrin heavy chain